MTETGFPDGDLDAVVVIDKPEGKTSHQVVGIVKRMLGVAKAGHTGTLDPFATGVLPVCLNQATKTSRFFLESDKAYEAVMVLGVETDTLDVTGEIVSTGQTIGVDRDKIETAGKRFLGTIEQKPPAYSAVKVKGERLYRLARKGICVDVPTRRIEIRDIRVLDVSLPKVRFRVDCSAGTYVRVLASDWGRALGCGAHLAELRRLRCGRFVVEQALGLEELEQSVRARDLHRCLVPMVEALNHLPSIRVEPSVARKIRHGWHPEVRQLGLDSGVTCRPGEDVFRVVSEGNDLVAVMAPVREDGNGRVERLRPLRVFNV